MARYSVLLSDETRARLLAYRDLLGQGQQPGRHLASALADLTGQAVGALDLPAFLTRLLSTKKPLIFAESAVAGDGSDWTQEELRLLGDVSVATPVTVYDDGVHRGPAVHARPFEATLLFTPGALLAAGHGGRPVDWDEVVRDGRIDRAGYAALYERRLLPALVHASEVARARGRKAIITVPGLGCGQFAGRFRGTLGQELADALVALLSRHAERLSPVKLIHFDPFQECDNAQQLFGQTWLRVRPHARGNQGTPQLCPPQAYAQAGEDFSDCDLFSVVAWDHVSWPGNDFYGGSRATDDGVKAAATNAMQVMTGVEGRYDARSHQYRPPAPFRTWEDLVLRQGLRMHVDAGNLVCVPLRPGPGHAAEARAEPPTANRPLP